MNKQLYSIIAIAVILIIVSHWIPKDNIISSIPTGAIGVSILFVLSGYLLTRKLLEKKESGSAKLKSIKEFYLWCLLKFLPIYFLVIFPLFLFYEDQDVERSIYIYLATFTTNFYFYKTQAWAGIFSHLWILAAAAQFFLIWPWVILFTNKKYLVHIIIVCVLTGIISQIALGNIKMGSVLPFTCLDSLGLGALLAWITKYQIHARKFLRGAFICAIFSFILFIIALFKPEWISVPARILASVITFWFISYVIYNEKNIFAFILKNKILVFIGTIGYGVFFYHNILPPFTFNSLIYINGFLPAAISKYMGYLIFFENFILVIIVSWLSWIIIEKTFMRLGKQHDDKNELSTLATAKMR